MEFIALSEKQIRDTRYYSSIRQKHVVISITSVDAEEIMIPTNQFRANKLHLKFDDVSDIDSEFTFFTQDQAAQILEFVEKCCTQISLIVVQCQAGVSRSVAVASALSKIINNTDDRIFTTGIPNMFVYTTLLEAFFGNRFWKQKYPKINLLRNEALAKTTTLPLARLDNAREIKRMKKEI